MIASQASDGETQVKTDRGKFPGGGEVKSAHPHHTRRKGTQLRADRSARGSRFPGGCGGHWGADAASRCPVQCEHFDVAHILGRAGLGVSAQHNDRSEKYPHSRRKPPGHRWARCWLPHGRGSTSLPTQALPKVRKKPQRLTGGTANWAVCNYTP